MPPRPSMAVFSWHELPLQEALAEIAGLGLGRVDLGVFPDRYQLRTDELLEDARACACRVSAALERHRLNVADIFFHPGRTADELAPNHPDSAHVEEATRRLNAVLAFAKELNVPHVTTLPGVAFQKESAHADMDASVKTLRKWVERAGDSGLTLGVEPHVGSIIDSPARVLGLMGGVPGLGLTLDPSHFVCDGIDFPRVRILATLATHAHLRPACTGRLQCQFEQNTIPFQTFMSLLDSRRCPSAAIELVRPRPMCDAVDVAETARRILALFPQAASSPS